MPFLLLALGVGAGVLLWKAPFWAAERRAQKHLAWLRAASADELASHLVGLVRYERWERFDAARAFSEKRRWTDAALLEALETFAKAVEREDVARGQRGRDSHVFELHDAGFFAIRDALDQRARS